MKQTIYLTEADLRNIVRGVINEMGTPKQNAFLRKLMGNRYKDEYDNLSPKDSSKMIDAELANSNTPQREYEVVDTIGGKPDIYPCVGFYNAKKKLGEIVEDYYNNGWSAVGDVWLRKDTDIRWVAGGRNLGYCGSIYIRRKK